VDVQQAVLLSSYAILVYHRVVSFISYDVARIAGEFCSPGGCPALWQRGCWRYVLPCIIHV
jgi:hypothetical protein